MLVMLMVVFFNRQFKVSYFYGDPHTFHRNPGCQNRLQNEFHNFAHIATILHAKSCHNIPVEFAHQKNITKKLEIALPNLPGNVRYQLLAVVWRLYLLDHNSVGQVLCAGCGCGTLSVGGDGSLSACRVRFGHHHA